MTIAHTGESAHAYFERLRAEQAQPVESIEQGSVQVVEPWRELDEDELSALKGTHGALIKRLISSGWKVRVGSATALMPDELYKSNGEGHNAGDVRYPAHLLETLVIQGVKRASGSMLAMEGAWTRKQGKSWMFKGARTFDPYLGEEWRPRASSPRAPLAWEKEEGVQPPLGLNQWLTIVAPTKAELKAKEKK